MSIDLKTLAGKFGTVAGSVKNPIALMVMGYISNGLLMLYNQGTGNPTVVKTVRIVAFSVREFEPELKELVAKSPTPYDDKLVDELLEVVDDVLKEAGEEVTSSG